MKDDSYGKWMYEILTRLKITDAILVGISFGGFISWKTLSFDEKHIAKAFLIVPAGIVNGNPLKALWKVFLPMKRYQRSKNTKYVHQFLNALFTAKDEFAFNFLSKVFLHFEMDFSPIPTIKAAAARKITTPLYLIAAKKDVLFPGAKMIKRAKQLFPSLENVLLLPDAKHVPDELDNERLTNYIRENSK
jgi:pimeloyl-ACP methyl ester carboxylesterase